MFFDGDRVAEFALRNPLCISDETDELRVGFCELEGPVTFNFGSLDIPLAPDDPDALAPIPVDVLRLGCVQGLDVPIERRDSMLIFYPGILLWVNITNKNKRHETRMDKRIGGTILASLNLKSYYTGIFTPI